MPDTDDEYWDDTIDWEAASTPLRLVTPSVTSTAGGSNTNIVSTSSSTVAATSLVNSREGTSRATQNPITISKSASRPMPTASTKPNEAQQLSPTSRKRKRIQRMMDVLKDGSNEDTARKRSKEDIDSPKAKKEVTLEGQESPGIKIRGALSRYDDELTCATCLELFVVPQVLNPCGHTTCGDCIEHWIKRNSHSPTCPVCRESLNREAPYLPNFSINSTVEKHIELLRSHKVAEWQEDGSKWLDWSKRKRVHEKLKTSKPPAPKPPLSLPDHRANYVFSFMSGGTSRREMARGIAPGRGRMPTFIVEEDVNALDEFDIDAALDEVFAIHERETRRGMNAANAINVESSGPETSSGEESEDA